MTRSTLLTLFLLASAIPVHAQTATETPWLSAPKVQRCEGTITFTNPQGVTAVAQMQFQAPDQLRLELQANPAALIQPQTVVANGDTTHIYQSATKRVFELPYNITSQWFRDWGLQAAGPANFAIFGGSQAGVEHLYKASTALTQAGLEVSLAARPEIGGFWDRDLVRFGGGGKSGFYAAFQQQAFSRPATLRLTLDPQTKAARRLDRSDGAGRNVLTSTIALDPATRLPISCDTTDSAGHPVCHFAYAVKARADPFAADAFVLPATADAMTEYPIRPEAETTQSPRPERADARILALAHRAEDYPAALGLLGNAARQFPQAVAPWLNIYNITLEMRDYGQAQQALIHLGQLWGADSFEFASRQAQLDILTRDWPAAKDALATAQAAAPQDLGIALLSADLLRQHGDYANAQIALQQIVKSDLPQATTEVAAAEDLAAVACGAGGPAAEDALKAMPQDTPWQRLARAHLALLLGKTDIDTKFDSDEALASLAQGLERQSRAPEAVAAWKTIAARAPLQARRVAQEHLAALDAGAGDFDGSIALFHELVANSPSEATREGEQSVMLGIWMRSGRMDQFHAALQQHALASTVGEADLRLWLAYQETYGSPHDVSDAIDLGIARFPDSAWWQSRLAELKMDDATSQLSSVEGIAERARSTQAAQKAVKHAIDDAPEQPYYAVQRSLILTERATYNSPIVDPAQIIADHQAANDAAAALVAKWPDNQDVNIAAGIERADLSLNSELDPAVRMLKDALLMSPPEGFSNAANAHQAAFAARQALAAALRRQQDAAAAAHQYDLLMDASGSVGEEVGVAGNYLFLLNGAGDATDIAHLLARMAGEPWPFRVAQDGLETLCAGLANQPAATDAVAAQLLSDHDAASDLALFHLEKDLLRLAQTAAAQPDAEPHTDAVLRQVSANYVTARATLGPIADGDNKLLAARACAFLGEDEINAGHTDEGISYLARAVALEPLDLDLRAALVNAYLGTGKTKEATAARDDILCCLPQTIEVLRHVAQISTDLRLPDDATRFALQALHQVRTDPSTTNNEFQSTAFVAARALLTQGQVAAADAIYSQLSAPQWNPQDRAAALLDWQAGLRAGGHVTEADRLNQPLTALGLDQDSLESAAAWLHSVQ